MRVAITKVSNHQYIEFKEIETVDELFKMALDLGQMLIIHDERMLDGDFEPTIPVVQIYDSFRE